MTLPISVNTQEDKRGRERAGLLSHKLNIKSCEACFAEHGNTSSATVNVAFSPREVRKANRMHY
jgi:hypothetical protein